MGHDGACDTRRRALRSERQHTKQRGGQYRELQQGVIGAEVQQYRGHRVADTAVGQFRLNECPDARPALVLVCIEKRPRSGERQADYQVGKSQHLPGGTAPPGRGLASRFPSR